MKEYQEEKGMRKEERDREDKKKTEKEKMNRDKRMKCRKIILDILQLKSSGQSTRNTLQ
jgi:hypothetical protein